MLEPAPGPPVETTLVEASRQNHPSPAQVDDLTDIGNLEGYVDRSAVVLMLLSRGYLTSRNCLREVVATQASHLVLPVVLVEPINGS